MPENLLLHISVIPPHKIFIACNATPTCMTHPHMDHHIVLCQQCPLAMRHPSWMIVGVSHNLAFSIAPYDCHQEPIRIAAHAYWDDISRVIELIFDLLRDKHPPSGGFIKVLSSILVCISGYFLVDLRCHLLNSKFITSNSKIINVPICETFITCNAHMHPLHRLAHCLMPTVKSCDSSTMVFSVLYVNPL